MVVTLKDISKAAGVSIGTISNILNNRPVPYKAETRRKVEKIVRTLGYKPNPMARTLTGAKANLLGIISPSFFMELTHLEHMAEHAGYSVQLSAHRNYEDELIRTAKDFLQRGVEGILVFYPVGQAIEEIHKLAPYTPLVVCGEAPYAGIDSFINPTRQATRLATEYLIKKGHTKIGMVCYAEARGPVQSRHLGFREALSEYGIGYQSQYFSPLQEADHTVMAGYEAVKKSIKLWQAAGDLPTALVTSNDEIAMGGIVAAQEAGLRVPQDLSIMGLMDLPIAPFARATLPR